MRAISSGPIVLAAGGTGGHLFPAEAVARELIMRGRKVALVTDRRGTKFPVPGVDTYPIPTGRVGAGVVSKLKGGVGLGVGTVAAWRLLGRLKPAAAIGFGGYPSVPTMMAASWHGLPTIIHEQNAVLGLANKILAPRVRKIATHFAGVTGLKPGNGPAKLVHTGNPVRPDFAQIRERLYEAPDRDGPFRILVTGGSQGARILSKVVPAALALLPDALKPRLSVSQQARPEDITTVVGAYAASGIAAEIRGFFDDIPARMGDAHLIVCRAGGSTTAELTVAGRPAIFIPYAAAIADEQTANARNLVDRGAGWMLSEAAFAPDRLAQMIAELAADPAQLTAAAAAARAMGQPRAASRLADLVEEVAGMQASLEVAA